MFLEFSTIGHVQAESSIHVIPVCSIVLWLTILTGKDLLLNSVQEFIETKAWLLLTFSYVSQSINFYYILL